MAAATVHLVPTNDAPSRAREFLRKWLDNTAHLATGETTELLGSELVTNAVRHAGTPMTVRALRDGARLRVEVDDSSSELPVVHHPCSHEDAGRGLLLVETLASRWGVDSRPNGKTVWFELDLDGQT